MSDPRKRLASHRSPVTSRRRGGGDDDDDDNDDKVVEMDDDSADPGAVANVSTDKNTSDVDDVDDDLNFANFLPAIMRDVPAEPNNPEFLPLVSAEQLDSTSLNLNVRDMLLNLPADAIYMIIAKFLTQADIASLCKTSAAFAYRFCGITKHRNRQTGKELREFTSIDDKKVAWQIHSEFLKRDFGLSMAPEECSNDSQLFREMNASAVRAFIAADIAAMNIPPDEPNRAKLLAYRNLYMILDDSYKDGTEFSDFERKGGQNNQFLYIRRVTFLDLNIVSVAVGYQNVANDEWVKSSFLISSVAIFSALEDLAVPDSDKNTIFYGLATGYYGKIQKTVGGGLTRVQRSIDNIIKDISCVAVSSITETTFVIPRTAWPSTTGEKNADMVPLGVRKEAALEDIVGESYRQLLPNIFLNDRGDQMLFHVFVASPGGGRSLMQYAAESHEEANGSLILKQSVQLQYDFVNSAGVPVLYSFFEPISQTEKTYAILRDLNRRASRWSSVDGTIEIRTFMPPSVVFRISFLDLIDRFEMPRSATGYRVYLNTCAYKYSDTEWAGRYIFCVSMFDVITPTEVAEHPGSTLVDIANVYQSFWFIKVDLKPNGLVHQAKLYRVNGKYTQFRSLATVNSRFSFLIDLISQEGEENDYYFAIDWELETIRYYAIGSDPFQLDSPREDYIWVPRLDYTNYGITADLHEMVTVDELEDEWMNLSYSKLLVYDITAMTTP